jgi:3-methyladenine DNA glycosylase AlkD
MNRDDILREIEALGSPEAVAGMARFGIRGQKVYGVSMPNLRALAKRAGKDHPLAEELWLSGVHEARIVACLVDDPARVTEEQMERWAGDFDSWDVCDQCCGGLFDRTPLAYAKALEWSGRTEEFVKRAGFALMAYLAVHDKKADDADFLQFLPAIKRESTDKRNFVKKAVNWALRQIGKRNVSLNRAAIDTAREIQRIDSSAARWVASDALRELTGEAVQSKLRA